jgi:hypothetical protein
VNWVRKKGKERREQLDTRKRKNEPSKKEKGIVRTVVVLLGPTGKAGHETSAACWLLIPLAILHPELIHAQFEESLRAV